MSVWYCIPSARHPHEANAVLAAWRAQGYKLAVFHDYEAEPVIADHIIYGAYVGYAAAVNALASFVLSEDPGAEWIVTGGDDLYPDETHPADEIAAICRGHFNGTFGVMQPTGDAYGALANDTAAVSPWMGREWCRRINGGRGPLWPEYPHYYVDAELMDVASRHGVMLRIDDLTQYHDHYLRDGRANCPEHLKRWQTTNEASRMLYERRKSAGFPGSEPLP